MVDGQPVAKYSYDVNPIPDIEEAIVKALSRLDSSNSNEEEGVGATTASAASAAAAADL